MARAREENFPVASRLLPRAARAHLLAIYGFARLVDQIGDDLAGDRSAALDWVDAELDRVYGGEPAHPLMKRLAVTVAECHLPRDPLDRLVAANRQDQEVDCYETIGELVGYCELSANPVGHLVLHVFGVATPDRLRLSDDVCTGLQLTEHWQDVAEDLERGRVYLPKEDMERFGCGPEDLERRPSAPAVRRLLAFEVGRARELLDSGVALVAGLRGRPRLAVAAFVAGGRAALGAIERADYEVLAGAPRATRTDRLRALAGVLAEARRA